MSSDSIDEEARISEERLSDQAAEIICGSIRELAGLKPTVIALPRSATVADAVDAMIENKMGAVLIVEDGQLFGLFTERDILTRVVAAERVPSQTPITEVMTTSPECLSFDDEIVFALNRMTVGGFRHVPILDENGVPTTVVSMRDVVEHIVSFYSNEVFNLPSSPGEGAFSHREGA
ncbi:MAG: CBS domain-containing protein [Fuerstiella sp.]